MTQHRAVPGTPFRPSARAHNLAMEAADATQRSLGGSGPVKPKDHDVIYVRNDYAFTLVRHAPCGIDMVIPEQNMQALNTTPTADPNNVEKEKAEAYKHQHIYSATKPMARHGSRWAILMRSLEPGEIGPAVMTGVAVARTQSTVVDGVNPFYTNESRAAFPVASYHERTDRGDAVDRVYDQQWFYDDHTLRQASTYLGTGYSERLPASTINWMAKASILDARHTTQADFACDGTGSFICHEGKWHVLSENCSESCTVARHPELDAGGVNFGLDLPCTENETIYGLPCWPEHRWIGEVVMSREYPQSDPETCTHNRICVRECEDTGGGSYAWSITYGCDDKAYNEECVCPSIDENVYPCTADSQPRHVVFSCMDTSTTTTTGDPSTTTTSWPPCAGDCYAECAYDAVTNLSYVWHYYDTCSGGNPWDPLNQRCSCVGIDWTLRDCLPEECGVRRVGTCLSGIETTTTTTTSAIPGTTTTTQEPPPTCTDTCTWTCGEPVFGGTAIRWYLSEECDTETCCRHCPPPTGECCTDDDVGDTEQKNCGAYGTPSSLAPCTTTTAAPTTTTTSADPSSTTTTTAAPTTTTTAAPTSTTTEEPCDCCCVAGSCISDTGPIACAGLGGTCIPVADCTTTTTSADPSSTTTSFPPTTTSADPSSTTSSGAP